MAGTLIATELFAPRPRPSLVSRARLLERLDAGLHRKLTLVSAPAGYGKTTLIGDWMSRSRRPVAWVSLDEGDVDVSRFMAYVLTAAHGAFGVGESARRSLDIGGAESTQSVIATFLNEVAILPQLKVSRRTEAVARARLGYPGERWGNELG